MLIKIIDEYLSEKRQEYIRDNSKFRVSDAGRCHLMRYWKRQGKPASDEPDERTYRVFEVGHVFHMWLQDILQEKGVLVGKEVKVEDLHRIGHVDAIIQTEEGLILYDFKTVHSRKFHHKRRERMEGSNGDIHYAIQAYTYSEMLPFGCHDVRIAYISKDDLCIEETSVLEMANISDLVTEDWHKLIDTWERQVEPEPNPMPWECGYCSYKSGCNYGQKVLTEAEEAKKNKKKKEAKQ